jgi:hypothetical protein
MPVPVPPEGELLFREVQPWRDHWTGALLYLSGIAIAAGFGYVLFQQLVLGHPVGARPAPDLALLLLGGMIVVLGVALAWLGLRGELVAEVRRDALCVQHFPLTRRHCFPYDQTVSAQARTYKPLREFGGYGVRWGLLGRGKAYNVSGNQGVQLVFRDGARLLVGSLRAQALANAINDARAAAGQT